MPSDTHENCGCGHGAAQGSGHGHDGHGHQHFDGGAGLVEAPVLSTEPRLDVRAIPHERRHATVLDTIAALPSGEAIVLIAPHAPRPLLAQVEARFGGQMRVDYLQSGPEVWQVRVRRVAAAVG